MGQPFQQGYKYAHISTSTTTTLITSLPAQGSPGNPAGSVGLFGGLRINAPGTGWTITVQDGPGGAVVAVYTPSAPMPADDVPIQMQVGLSIVTTGATPGDVTVAYA